MIKIKTGSVTVVNELHNLMACQPSAGTCYFKFGDGTELIVPTKLSSQLQAALTVVQQSKAESIEIDFTNPAQPIKMGNLQ